MLPLFRASWRRLTSVHRSLRRHPLAILIHESVVSSQRAYTRCFSDFGRRVIPARVSDDIPSLSIRFNMSTESIEGYVPVNFAKEPEKALVIWTRVNKAKSRVTIEYAARVLIKKKMLELGYAYTGWGPTPGPLIHEWRDWHSHTGLYSGELSEEVTRDVLQYLNDRVKAWSQEFFDIGAFGFGSIGFCVGSHTREMFKNKYIVHVAEWAVDQSLKTDWNGELQVSISTSLDIKSNSRHRRQGKLCAKHVV